MEQVSLKFRIKEHLENIPKGDYSEFLKKLQDSGIKLPTFYAWVRIRKSEKRSIPIDSLKIIADQLQVSIEDLIAKDNE